eukprot:6184339-Pleurochrysis_carterae.AAC.7
MRNDFPSKFAASSLIVAASVSRASAADSVDVHFAASPGGNSGVELGFPSVLRPPRLTIPCSLMCRAARRRGTVRPRRRHLPAV